MNATSLAFGNGEDMAELASTMLVGRESMYVAVFKEACHGVLLQEAHLFSNEEKDYLTRALDLPYDALYILVRLSLRKLKWHRQSDLESHYLPELVSEARIRSACDLLSSKSGQISSPLTKLPTSQSSQHSGPLSTKNTYSTNQIDIIDLTVDDDDDDEDENVQGQVGMGSTTQTKTEPNEEPRLSTGGGAQPLSLAYHANNHTCAGLRALLETLSAKETQELARDVKVYKPGMKSADLISGLLRNSNKQTTLNFKGKTPINYKDRITSMVIEKLGYCIILNELVLSLFRRIHIVYFRSSFYDPQLFVPAILVRCKKRNYVQYEHQRTEGIFRCREQLLDYEEALAAEAKMELARDAYIAHGSDTAQTLFEEVYTWVHARYAEEVDKVDMKRSRKDSLERFETGHVLVRILHHCGDLINKIKGAHAEADLLRMLLQQTRWKRGSRGRWYDRLGLLLMKDKDDKVALQEAIKVVRAGLEDEFTQLRYRPSLCRRLARLETMLDVPTRERWKNEATLNGCDHVYVEGIRSDEVALDKFGHPKSASHAADSSEWTQVPTRKFGRSLWSGREETVNVEQLAIEYYESLGYQAIHSEGSVVRFIFALLFKDILFKPVPGALETEYQTGPLDLDEGSFYFVRQKDIAQRLEAIESGQALHIARKVDAEHRDKKTMWVGALWDKFTREDILAIIECLPASVLMIMCRLQAENYSGSAGGVPDLIVWNHGKREAKFVEVKGPGDTLSETQKLWIHWLLSFDATVEVCHIETPADRRERLKKAKKGKRSAEAKGETKRKRADAESIAGEEFYEIESDGEVDGSLPGIPAKRRKSQSDDEGYQPQKKSRTG